MCQRLGIREDDFLLSPCESGRNCKKGCKQIVLLVEKRRLDVQRPGQTLPHYDRGMCLPLSYWLMRALTENSLMPAWMPSCSWVRPELKRA